MHLYPVKEVPRDATDYIDVRGVEKKEDDDEDDDEDDEDEDDEDEDDEDEDDAEREQRLTRMRDYARSRREAEDRNPIILHMQYIAYNKLHTTNYYYFLMMSNLLSTNVVVIVLVWL